MLDAPKWLKRVGTSIGTIECDHAVEKSKRKNIFHTKILHKKFSCGII